MKAAEVNQREKREGSTEKLALKEKGSGNAGPHQVDKSDQEESYLCGLSSLGFDCDSLL